MQTAGRMRMFVLKHVQGARFIARTSHTVAIPHGVTRGVRQFVYHILQEGAHLFPHVLGSTGGVSRFANGLSRWLPGSDNRTMCSGALAFAPGQPVI